MKMSFKLELHFILLTLLSYTELAHTFSANEIRLHCSGKRHENVSMAAYYPIYNYDDSEEGIKDKKGKKLMTLQDYLDNRAAYVTLAMDEKLAIPYGTSVCIPELNEHFGQMIKFEVRDSGSNLDGMGYHRVDICVRSEIDSYDTIVNRKVTLFFNNKF